MISCLNNYFCEFANIILQNKEENAKDNETKSNTNKPTNQPKQNFPPACQF